MSTAPQPVSVHKGGGAGYMIVIGLLGVLLVTETIGLGYLAMQFVGMQSQQAEILAENPDIVEGVLEAEVQTHAILSKLVFDQEPEVLRLGESGTTYLREKYLNEIEDTSCEMVRSLVDPAYQNNFGATSGGVTDPDVRALFSERMTDEGLTQLDRSLEREKYTLYQVCPGEDGDYVILLDEATHTVATIAQYLNNGKQVYWRYFQPVAEVMDGAVWFLPNFFPDGSPLLATGYGDAGFVWWNFWMPTTQGATYLVESCAEGPHFSEGEGSKYPVEADGRELVCKVQYIE